MPANKRKRKVLFVDDDHLIHRYTYDIAHELKLGHKHAHSVEEAVRAITQRIKAIRALEIAKRKQLVKVKNKREKEKLTKQLEYLAKLRKKPFDLIVSDINMPKYVPTGIFFAARMNKKYPKQSLLIHSDDYVAMEGLKRKFNIPYVSKIDFNVDTTLKNKIKKMLEE